MNYKLLLMLLVFQLGCKSRLDPPELLRWVEEEENGCTVNVSQPGFEFSSTYFPPQLLAYKQIHVLEEDYSDSLYEALVKEYQKGCHFRFSVQTGAQNQTDLNTLLADNSQYLNFYISQDLKLLNGSDTIPCAMAVLERSANISKRLTYELVFDLPQDKNTQDLKLIYNGPLNQGNPVTFEFEQKNIANIPSLKKDNL